MPLDSLPLQYDLRRTAADRIPDVKALAGVGRKAQGCDDLGIRGQEDICPGLRQRLRGTGLRLALLFIQLFDQIRFYNSEYDSAFLFLRSTRLHPQAVPPF